MKPRKVAPQVQRVCGYTAVCDFANLYEAHRKARRGKMHKREVVEFELSLAENLLRLREELLSRTYDIAGYYRFVVTDPKRRDVHALRYRDRVVQHALCDNVLEPVLDPRLIYDNAASRRGKGTHFALDRLEGFLREHYREHGTEGYILKFDVRKYYSSISHRILKELFESYFHYDPRVCWLVGRIIDSYSDGAGRGIPLGNQASSWFAITYLDGLDRLVKEHLRVKRYTRYMDDGVLVHEDRDFLRHCLVMMRGYAYSERGLQFNEKTQIVPLSQGVDYLGFHLYLTDTGKVVRKLRASNKRRMKAKLKRYRHAYRVGKVSADAVNRSLTSYLAHLEHGDTWRLRQRLLGHLVLSNSTCEQREWDRNNPLVLPSEGMAPIGARGDGGGGAGGARSGGRGWSAGLRVRRRDGGAAPGACDEDVEVTESRAGRAWRAL